MEPHSTPATQSKALYWTGWVFTGLIVIGLGMGAVMNLAPSEQIIKDSAEMGIPESILRPVGVVLLVSIILYAIPQTSVFGAILLTGYYGGAILTHVRLEQPIYMILPAIIAATLTWLGIYFREPRLREIVFWRK